MSLIFSWMEPSWLFFSSKISCILIVESQRLVQEITLKLLSECLWQFLTPTPTRLQMWMWSCAGVRELPDNFQTTIDDSLSSSETGVNFGIRSWKKHFSEWAWCQKAIGGIYSTKKWRAETLQPGLEFDYFKPWLESGFFKCISWLNGSIFGGWWSWFYERGSQDLSYGANSAT